MCEGWFRVLQRVNVPGDCGFAAVGYMRRVVMGLQRRVVVVSEGGCVRGHGGGFPLVYVREVSFL
jgi:hypothetical protein